MLELLFVSMLSGALYQAEPTAPSETPAQAQAAPADVGPDIVVQAPQDSDDDPIVCMPQARTGSILRRNVCRPQSEIEREREDSQFRLRNMRRWGHIRERSPM